MTRDERLAAIRARCEATTTGPWCHYEGEIRQGQGVDAQLGGPVVARTWANPQAVWGPAQDIVDAAFVAHARADIPWLLGELACSDKRAAQLEKNALDLGRCWENAAARSERAEAALDQVVHWGPADAGRIVFEELQKAHAENARLRQALSEIADNNETEKR